MHPVDPAQSDGGHSLALCNEHHLFFMVENSGRNFWLVGCNPAAAYVKMKKTFLPVQTTWYPAAGGQRRHPTLKDVFALVRRGR